MADCDQLNPSIFLNFNHPVELVHNKCSLQDGKKLSYGFENFNNGDRSASFSKVLCNCELSYFRLMFEKIGNETRYFKMNRNGVGTAQREPYSWIVEEKPETAKLEKKKAVNL